MWQDRLAEFAVSVTNYASSASVKKHNTAVDGLRALIAQVGSHSSSELDELLMYLDDGRLRGWIAYGVLERCSPNQAQRSKCLAVVRELARADGPEALAAKWWLRDHGEAS
jgi:hypothetical protein